MTPITYYVVPEVTRMKTFQDTSDMQQAISDIRTTLTKSGEAMRLATLRIGELETVLNRMVLAHENTLSDSDGRFPRPDMGCPDCTSGTVPDALNTGRCAYHESKVLLGQL